jgi:hypothetical protein
MILFHLHDLDHFRTSEPACLISVQHGEAEFQNIFFHIIRHTTGGTLWDIMYAALECDIENIVVLGDEALDLIRKHVARTYGVRTKKTVISGLTNFDDFKKKKPFLLVVKMISRI